MRIIAALALASGLMLSSVGVAPATAEPEETQSPADETDTPSPRPSPSPTETETDADPTSEPTEGTEDDDVEDEETDQQDVRQQETDEEEDREGEEDATAPSPEHVRVECTNVTIEAGQEVSINCHTTPAGATLSVGAPSQLGGSITVEGSQLLYRAPIDRNGTDTLTVVASALDYEDGTTRLTVNVEVPQEVTESATPEDPDPPAAPATTPPPEGAEDNTGAQTPDTLPSDPSVPVSSPPPSHTRQTQEPADLLLLPVPGMPREPEMTMPGTSHHTGNQTSHEDAGENRYDSLAMTGAGATFGAAGLAALSLALGTGMLVTSRRMRQR